MNLLYIDCGAFQNVPKNIQQRKLKKTLRNLTKRLFPELRSRCPNVSTGPYYLGLGSQGHFNTLGLSLFFFQCATTRLAGL